MNALPENGMVHVLSPWTVPQTVERIEAVLADKGLALKATIDHAADALAAGLSMPPTVLLIFGNAAAGTPVMLAAPTLAFDLPLKALVWQDSEGRVRVSYNSPEYLKQRHGIPDNLLPRISGGAALVELALQQEPLQ
jgi:uncharacterized protein (DUF302 family)